MAEKIREFYDLNAWKKGYEVCLLIYQATQKFPPAELYGMVSQLRRAASSITANIAEGFERYHFNDKIRFYHQSRGSTAEVQNFLLLAEGLKYINNADSKHLREKTNEVRKLINGLIKSIENQK